MSIKKYLTEKIDKIGAATSSITGGLTLGQFPQFLAQYVQRVGGAVDERRKIAIEETMPQLLERADELEASIEQIQASGTLEKIVSFVRHVDLDIARKTYEAFTPGMTFDSDGMTYIAVGAGLGFLAYEGGKSLVRAATKKYKR